jgi:hypothetical protein
MRSICAADLVATTVPTAEIMCRAALKDEKMPCTIPTGCGQHRYEKLQLKVRLSVGVLHLM